MKFFKTFLATLLAFFTGIFILFIFFLVVLSSSATQPEPFIKSDSVLTIKFSGAIPVKSTTDPFEEILSGQSQTPVSLESIRQTLKKAALDNRIQGIWLQMDIISSSWATLIELHKELTDFKESGKFIYASAGDIGLSEQSYYLATAADSIFAPSEAYFEFDGFVAQISYYENLLEKIGVKPEIFRVGKYKSAVEPYLLSESSPENREQYQRLLEHAKNEFLDKVSKKSGRSERDLDLLMDELYTGSMIAAYEAGLIDELMFPIDVEQKIKQRLGLAEDKDLETVNFSRYARVSNEKAGIESPQSENEIAVIYSSGAIMPDLGGVNPLASEGSITYGDLAEILTDLEEEDNVKGIVLYIDSPGGSASTSDMIWDRLKKTREQKPVVAVMGTVAASGGYYIAMGADTVVASAQTITGSIGIFRTMFNAQELMNERLGITFSEFQTDPHADIMQMTRPLSPTERRQLQRATEQGYERFLSVVAESREMTRDEVHQVAQGRVWTGQDAFERGLVDVIGNLQTGIDLAAEMAGIEEYKTISLPKEKDILQRLLDSGSDAAVRWTTSWIPAPIENLFEQSSPTLLDATANQNMALMPYRITIQ